MSNFVRGIWYWALGIGHPFSARRYANGFAQGKWALGMGRGTEGKIFSPAPHLPISPSPHLPTPHPTRLFPVDVSALNNWLEFPLVASATMERIPSKVAGIVRGSINMTLLLSLLPILVPISR